MIVSQVPLKILAVFQFNKHTYIKGVCFLLEWVLANQMEEMQEEREQREKEVIYPLARYTMNSTQYFCHTMSMDEVWLRR